MFVAVLDTVRPASQEADSEWSQLELVATKQPIQIEADTDAELPTHTAAAKR